MSHPTPAQFIAAARVPDSVEPQDFGLWQITRRTFTDPDHLAEIGFPTQTSLCRWTDATIHLGAGEIVMEDSRRELRKHLPIWMQAKGRVLKTGLGLGCVVRGLLINPAVEHVDVVEIDADIVRIIGAEFAGNPRVTIHHADALTWDFGDRLWDIAWHDIWTEGNNGLDALHVQLMDRFNARAGYQGAWAFPRVVQRALPWRMLGAARTPRQRKAA